MKMSEFKNIINQMKITSVPRRLICLWQGKAMDLDNILREIEIHKIDLALIEKKGDLNEKNTAQQIERYMTYMLKKYESERTEPSALVISNAVLLSRYSCEMTALLKYGISPRSMVILVFPKAASKMLPIKAERWIKNNTESLIERIGLQLGSPNCVIDDLGAYNE